MIDPQALAACAAEQGIKDVAVLYRFYCLWVASLDMFGALRGTTPNSDEDMDSMGPQDGPGTDESEDTEKK